MTEYSKGIISGLEYVQHYAQSRCDCFYILANSARKYGNTESAEHFEQRAIALIEVSDAIDNIKSIFSSDDM